MKQLLATYISTLDEIFKSFGIEHGYGELSIEAHNYFQLDEETVRWQDTRFDYDDEANYSNDVQNIYENDTHYLVYVHSCTGDSYYQIFDKSMEITPVIMLKK